MSARVVHVKDKVEGSVYIGRWNSYHNLQKSIFANPFKVGPDYARGEAVKAYEEWITQGAGRKLLKSLPLLRDKPLACWCRSDGEDEPKCHGDVLVTLLNMYTDEELEKMT